MSKTGAESARERAAQDKCNSCSRPRTHGVRCLEHWWRLKRKSALFTRRLEKLGMCGGCGKRPPIKHEITGEELCQVCIDGGHLRKPAQPKLPKQPHVVFDKPWHQRNVEAGYCMLGGKNHPRPTGKHKVCDLCRVKKSTHGKLPETRVKTNETRHTIKD